MTIKEEEKRVGSGDAGGVGAAPAVRVRRKAPSKTRRLAKRLTLLGLLGVAAGAGVVYQAPIQEWVHDRFAASAPAEEGIHIFTVKRGPLAVTMVEQGKLQAVKNSLIMLEVNGKITWLAEAGAKVKAGDNLVKIDTKEYEDQKRTLAGELETAKQQLVAAQQALPTAQSKGESDVAAAQTKKEQADLALKLYTTLDVPKKLADFETQINDARTKLQEAKKKQADYQAALDEELMQDDEARKGAEDALALQKQSVTSITRVITNLEDQRKLYRAYNYPQDLKDKQQALANSALEVTRSQITAKGDVAQKQADLAKANATIERLGFEMKRLDEQMAKCTVCAPTDGLVYYGSPDLDRYGDMSSQIHVGAEWYSNYPIMNIPDLSAFMVNFSIAEVYRSRITEGAPATITVDAIPGLTMTGKLTSISRVSRGRISWDSTSPQVFDTKLLVDNRDTRLVAGMTVEVTMTTAYEKDTLMVPVECVFNDAGTTVAYVRRPAGTKEHPNEGGDIPEKRVVATGLANDHFVAIAEGLKEGEQVLLSQPDRFFTPADYKEKAAALAASTRAAAAAAATMAATASGPASGPATGP